MTFPDDQYDQSLSSVRRLRDLLIGSAALMSRNDFFDEPDVGGDALKGLVGEARALADCMLEDFEQRVAVEAERQRQHAQGFKHIGQTVR